MRLDSARPNALDERIHEGLPAAFGLARQLCVDCLPYHALRPFFRVTEPNKGVRADWATMEPAVAALIAAGRRRVLVAGAGDTGIASLVLTAARGKPLALTVLDRCATPLVQVQQLAARHGLRVATRQDDLTRFDLPGSFDLVVAHHVLQFLPPGGPEPMLTRVARALAPGGRLLLASREARWRRWRNQEFAGPEGAAETYEAGMRARVEAAGVMPVGEARAAFDAFLRRNAQDRVRRTERYEEAEGLAPLLDRAGLEAEWSHETASVQQGPAETRPARSGEIVVARRRGEPAER